MVAIVGVIAVGIFIGIYEIPSLLKKNLKKEFWAFTILLSFSVVLGILNSLRINIPNPLDFLTIIYKPLTDLILGI